MATTVIKSIIPAGGGDYTSLADWVAARKGNIVVRDTVEVAEVYGGGSVGGLHLIRGDWTVDSTHYPIIRAATGQGHVGIFDTNKAYITGTDPDDLSVEIEVGFTRFGLGISVQPNGNPGTMISLGFGGAAVTPSILFEGAICRSATNDPMMSFSQNNAGNPYTLRNCVFYKSGNAEVLSSGGSATVEVLLYNSTVIAGVGGGAIAVNWQLGTITEQNNYFRAPTTVYDDGGTGTINKGNKSATSTAEAATAGLRNIAHSTATFTNVTYATADYHIISSSPLKDAGADLTASGVTVDYVGTARPQGSAFDIGAHELIPSAPTGGKSFFVFGL